MSHDQNLLKLIRELRIERRELLNKISALENNIKELEQRVKDWEDECGGKFYPKVRT